jgi:hypothetical protein
MQSTKGRVVVWVGVGCLSLLVGAWLALSIAVQLEGPLVEDTVGDGKQGRALVLFHPSRDARFADDLATAVSDGFRSTGLRVTRASLTGSTMSTPEGFTIIAVVSNTYYWAPDLPTRHYLRRATLKAPVVLGVMGGAGSTGRSERLLREALAGAGRGEVRARSFWLWRPNDKQRMNEPNRDVALDLARQFAITAASDAIARLWVE